MGGLSMSTIGTISLTASFGVAVYALMAYVLGLTRSSKRILESGKGAVMGTALLSTVAILALTNQFLTSDFTNAYVASNSSTDLPLVYKFSAIWAGNEGSLLLWYWILAIYAGIIAWVKQREGQELVPYVVAILMGISVFFTFVLNFVTNPFALTPVPVTEGNGLNPLLQNVGMIIHPPTTYWGYVGFTVPFAYAMAALITKRVGDTWIKVTRRWTLIAWLMLSIGMIYGAQWAYVELGWGGYWAWDPVENASLLPWLTATAFFHSVMIQERKGMLKSWNVVLIILTFVLTIFGTFLSRSGVLASVHAFHDGTLGAWLLLFGGTSLVAALWLFFDRSHLLREENQFESLLSKESSFLANNLILVGSAFTVFWGTVFPLISEAVRGVKVTVGPPFYNQVNVPLGIILIILMGICPLIPWRKATVENLKYNFLYPFGTAIVSAVALYIYGVTKWVAIIAYASSFFVIATIVIEWFRGVRVRMRLTGEGPILSFIRLSWRNRRRFGGYLVHLGIIFMILGFTGSGAYSISVEKTINAGEMITIGDYSVQYNGLEWTDRGRVGVAYADLEVIRNGEKLPGLLRAAKEFHPGQENSISEVGVLGGLKEDLFVVLAAWDKGGEEATFKILVNPLVAWIWIGEYVLILGTVFAIWPDRRRFSRAPSPGQTLAQ